MKYDFLAEEEQDDIVTLFMLAQERDHFSHTINLARYKSMLDSLPPGQFQERIQTLHDETVSRLAEVEAIMAATVLPPTTRMQSSIARVAAKGQ